MSNNTRNFITKRPAITEIWKRGARSYVRMCKCAPLIIRLSAKHDASGPLTTYQISAQSVQPVPKYGKGCERATCGCALPLTEVKVTSQNRPLVATLTAALSLKSGFKCIFGNHIELLCEMVMHMCKTLKVSDVLKILKERWP